MRNHQESWTDLHYASSLTMKFKTCQFSVLRVRSLYITLVVIQVTPWQPTSVFWSPLVSLASFQVRDLVNWSARSGHVIIVCKFHTCLCVSSSWISYTITELRMPLLEQQFHRWIFLPAKTSKTSFALRRRGIVKMFVAKIKTPSTSMPEPKFPIYLNLGTKCLLANGTSTPDSDLNVNAIV